jgi:hypothetical protein
VPEEPPALDRDGYERVERWTETAFSAPFVTVEAHLALYEDPAFRERVADAMPAGVERSPRSMFATGLSFSQPPPGGQTTAALLSVAARFARREFRSDLAADGLLDVTDAASRDLRVPGGREAKLFAFDAAYPLADAVDAATLPVRVWAAIWPVPGSYEMAGAVLPTGSLTLPDGSRLDPDPDGERRAVVETIRATAAAR